MVDIKKTPVEEERKLNDLKTLDSLISSLHLPILLDNEMALELSGLSEEAFQSLIEDGKIRQYLYKGQILYSRLSCILLE